MANKKISQLTAKGSALAATDLVEISEDAGGGNYVTKSVTGANVVSGLQPTLVSATNIKTINSNTILGSGDLVIAGGGGGVHVLTEPVSGRIYNVRTTGTAVNTASSTVANTISLYPFIPANSLTISNLQITVSTGTVGGLIRILVYSDLNGVPSSKLIESTSLDCSTTGVKTYTTSYTFTAGTVYWLGYYSNLAISINVYDASQMTPISASSHFNAFTNVTAAATFPTAPSTLGTATPVSSTGSNIGVINLTAA
jgi:hypothetical protein